MRQAAERGESMKIKTGDWLKLNRFEKHILLCLAIQAGRREKSETASA